MDMIEQMLTKCTLRRVAFIIYPAIMEIQAMKFIIYIHDYD